MNEKALQLLNQHLDDIVVLNGKQYPREKVARVYAKLNPQVPDQQFYSGDRVRGSIYNGNVSFETRYPETGWSYYSPQEKNLQTQSPRPTKELIAMSRAFQNLINSPEGKGVYFNSPVSEHRAEAYRKIGFVEPIEGVNTQILDNRRFTNSPIIAELLLTGDEILRPNDLILISQNLQRKHPQLPIKDYSYSLPLSSSSSGNYNWDEDEIDF